MIYVDDKQRIRQTFHVADAGQAAVQFDPLTLEHQGFFFRETHRCAAGNHLVQLN